MERRLAEAALGRDHKAVRRLLMWAEFILGGIHVATSSLLSWFTYGPLHGKYDTLFYLISDVVLFVGLGLIFHAVHIWRNP